MKRMPGVIMVGVIAVAILSAGAYALLTSSSISATRERPLRAIYTNNGFIDGLYNAIDLNNPKTVFAYIFSNLDPEVTVYPSENYYYFQFPANGRTISGSIGLLAHRIDDGILQLGYAEKPEERSRQKYFRMRGSSCDMSLNDSLRVAKINNFRYEVTYREKKVVFNFYRDSLAPPVKAKLTPDEVFVGPSFDESGLRFFLVFNKAVDRLYWVLNEDGFVGEQFTPWRPYSSVVIGDRTEFAFYMDSVNNRKILVGVNGENVLHNNWYDGPFDQMPDNYVKEGKVEVQEYLYRHYHLADGQIDKYGHYSNNENARIPVAPYIVYFSKDDLNFVDSCKALKMPQNAFYSKITTQIYNVPKDYYAGVYAK